MCVNNHSNVSQQTQSTHIMKGTHTIGIVAAALLVVGRLALAGPMHHASGGEARALLPETALSPSYAYPDVLHSPGLIAPDDWRVRYGDVLRFQLKSALGRESAWHVGPMLRYRPEVEDVLKSDEGWQVAADGDIVEVGPFLGFETDNWDGSLQVTRDVGGSYDGYLTTIEGGYSLLLNPRTHLRLGAETNYASGDYMRSYFAVEQERSLRGDWSQAEVDAGFRDVGLKARLSYSLSDRWTISGLLGYQRLVGEGEEGLRLRDDQEVERFFGGFIGIYNF